MATAIPALLGYVVARAYTTIAAQAATMKATPWLYELLPGGTRDVGHLAYGVGVIRDSPQDQIGKQRAGAEFNSAAEIGIRIMHRLRADALTTDYKAALVISDAVIAAMLTAADGKGSFQGAQKWHWIGTTVTVPADGTYVLIEQRYRVWHLTSIAL